MDGILIIKLGAIGDVLRTTVILSGLKEKCNLPIFWVTRRESVDILRTNPLITETFVLDNELNEKLTGKRFELIINLDDEDEACLLASTLNSKKIIGTYMVNGGKKYTKDSAQWFDMGLISRFGKSRADELKKLNKKTYQQHLYEILKIRPDKIILNLGKKELEFARKFAEKNSITRGDLLVGLNTSAGNRWQLKSLTIEKTSELADKLAEELNAKILLFGGKEESDRNEKIKKASKAGIIDAGCENSLLEFASLINLCDILVTSDSLAMHIATALKKRVVVFFGPTSSAEIELYGLGKKVVSGIDCVCCYKKECDKAPNCVDTLKVEDIVDVAKEIAKK